MNGADIYWTDAFLQDLRTKDAAMINEAHGGPGW